MISASRPTMQVTDRMNFSWTSSNPILNYLSGVPLSVQLTSVHCPALLSSSLLLRLVDSRLNSLSLFFSSHSDSFSLGTFIPTVCTRTNRKMVFLGERVDRLSFEIYYRLITVFRRLPGADGAGARHDYGRKEHALAQTLTMIVDFKTGRPAVCLRLPLLASRHLQFTEPTGLLSCFQGGQDNGASRSLSRNKLGTISVKCNLHRGFGSVIVIHFDTRSFAFPNFR